MAWLHDLAAITGARWSAGAVWADAGSPSVDDSDWEDATTWPAAHAYDPDATISLGLFVAGVDQTARIQALAWGLGASDPLGSGIQPSSCSLTLQDGALVAAGDRVAVLTDWDVLWTGRIEGWATTTDPERTVITAQAVDDMARAGLADVTDRHWGGDAMPAMDTMMLAAGVVGRAYTSAAGVHDPPPYNPDPSTPIPSYARQILATARSGAILGMISAAAYHLGWTAAYTPDGLRLAQMARHQDLDYRTIMESLGELRTITRDQGVASVRNQVELTGWGVAPLEYSDADPASQSAYGIRTFSVDGSGWFMAGAGAYAPLAWTISGFDGDALDFYDPVTMIQADARIGATRHRAQRALPFDYITDGDPDIVSTVDRWRILRVSQRVTPDDWSVGLECLTVSSDTTDTGAEGGLGLMGLGSEGLGE